MTVASNKRDEMRKKPWRKTVVFNRQWKYPDWEKSGTMHSVFYKTLQGNMKKQNKKNFKDQQVQILLSRFHTQACQKLFL